MAYSQANRPIRVTTPLGDDVLLLAGLAGSEGVSTPFAFTLDLLSESESIAGADLLQKPVAVTMTLADGSERFFHGRVREFMQLGLQDRLVAYRMEIVPAFWFLSLVSDCRIFQNMTALEIVQKVLTGVDLSVRCSKSYPAREYCVQYRETSLDFVSRLLEEEGIFYFFEHSANEHKMVLSDDPTSAKACPGADPAKMAASPQPWQESDVVVELMTSLAVHTGKVTLRDYNYLTPSNNLESRASGKLRFEQYDYPGEYGTAADGDRHARIRLEALSSRESQISGRGNCRFFVSGHTFDLADHYRRDLNASYHLLEIRHTARAGDYRSWDSAPLDYRNEFVAIPAATKFRPPRVTKAPVVAGTQTAVVVGPSGDEIAVDEHGRVKVQFHWDREGKNDEQSSCWVRVASTWAGTGWGFLQTPRIGQEVVVDFLEGDPDRPIIVGSVYNGNHVPPFSLPGEKTRSGVRSRSSLGGDAANANEIRFEDKKGSEQIFIHAEKDKIIEVENDRNETVGHDETYHVANNQTINVDNDQSITIGANQSSSIGKNRSENVGANESITIDGARTENVAKDEQVSIGGSRNLSVGKDENIDVGSNQSTTIGKNESLNVGESRTVQVGKDDTLQVGKNLVVDVGDSITIKTGDATFQLKKDGTITIKGKDISVDGSGKINIKASSDVVVKGSKVSNN